MKYFIRLFIGIFIFGGAISFLASGQKVAAQDVSKVFLSRGEVISNVVQGFDLKNKQKAFLEDCMNHIDECFFLFSARSNFDKLSFKPTLLLYPDVQPGYRYYDDINTASILELVQGYPNEKESPFRPRAYMTRIEALKVIMGAGDLIQWKERFEIAQEIGGEASFKNEQTPFLDVSGESDRMWWYVRYVNAALEKNILDAGQYFRPDEPITKAELNDMLQRAIQTAH